MMSKEYIVVLVRPEEKDSSEIDMHAAEIVMRFTERPEEEFLERLASARPGWRVFCLTGAASWHGAE